MTPDPDKLYDYCRDHKGLAEDIILIKHTLGIKEYRNGDRDKQILEAKARINEIGHLAEEEDKTLNEKIISLNTRLTVGETKMESIERYQKIILTAILGLIFGLVLFLIEFQWKTFILGL